MAAIDPAALCVMVTGASAGIGEATARRFADAGARVVVAARRRERLDALAAAFGERVHAITLDVRDQPATAAAVAGLPAPFNAIDVLVNNAGVGIDMVPAHEADTGDWNTTVDTNIKGVMWVTRAVLPSMVARNRGHVVNIGSTLAGQPQALRSVYAAAKAFIHDFSLNLRSDLLGTDVRVTCVEAGLVRTEIALARTGGDVARATDFYADRPPLEATDVAEAVFWATTLPARVNVNTVQLSSLRQAFAGMAWNATPLPD